MSSQPDIELVLAARLTEFLDGLTKAQDSIRRAVNEMSGTAKKGADEIDQSFRTLGIRSLKDVQGEIRQVQQAYRRLANSGTLSSEEQARAALAAQRRIAELQRSTQGLGNAWTQARGSILGASVAIGTTLVGLGRAAMASNEFGLAIAEVNSLLPEASTEIGAIEEQARALAREFGNSPTEQARAFYQAISAGAADAGEATDILTAANKLALGGVTDITTATDGLTSTLNAYGLSTDRSTEVSDLFFTAVKDGKTTVDELARSIGTVAPIAASTNVSLSDLLAGVAAITKGGVATSEAMTQVRSILSAVIKPTAEAQKLAKELGLEFDVAALKSKGFSQFIRDLIEATGGSEASLSRLLGRTEALQGALTLGGTQANSFNAILRDMENAAGATEQAVAKLADSDAFRSRRFQAAIADLQISLGQAVTAATPALELLGNLINRFNELPDSVRGTIAITAALAATIGSLGFAATAVSTPIRALLTQFKSLESTPGTLGRLQDGIRGNATASRLLSGALRGIPWVLLIQQIGSAVVEWNRYREAQQAATQSQREASESARDLQERIDSIKRTHQDFADVTVKTGEEIRNLTEREFSDYQDAIEKAQTLWRALHIEARRAGDAEGVEEAKAKLEEYDNALKAATQALQEVLEANQRFATDIGLLVAQFRAASGESDKLGKAIKTALASADDSGLRNVAFALGQLASQGTEDARQVREALASALGELDASKVERFAAQSQIAFSLINRNAEATSAVLQTTFNAALKNLGLETENLSGQAVANFRTIAESALSSSDQIEKAYIEALSRATNTQDVEALQAALTLAGQNGQVSMDAVAAGANRAATRLRQLRAESNPLSNDFEQLGIRSRKELEGVAETAEASYQRIRQAAATGAAAQEDVRAAFLAWGEAALEAADQADPATRRVIEQQVQLEGAAVGVKDALSELGVAAESSANRASSASRSAADGVRSVGQEAINVTVQLQHQIETTQTAGGALARVIGGALDSVRELSAGASGAVDDLIERLNGRVHGDPGAFLRRLGSELGYIREEFERQSTLADEVLANFDRVGSGAASLTEAIHLTTGQFQLLDQQRLDRLRSAIQQARQEAESFTQSVRDGTTSLRQELARLRGDEDEARRLEFQRRRDRILLQIEENKGNLAAQEELREQLKLLDEIEKRSGVNRGGGASIGQPQNNESDLTPGPNPTPTPVPLPNSQPGGGLNGGGLPGGGITIQFQSPDGLSIPGQFAQGDVNTLFEILRRSGATTSV